MHVILQCRLLSLRILNEAWQRRTMPRLAGCLGSGCRLLENFERRFTLCPSCLGSILDVMSEAPSAGQVTKPGEVDLEKVVADATWIALLESSQAWRFP